MVKYSVGLQQIKEKQVSGKLDVAQDLAALNVLHEDLHWALLAASKSGWVGGWGVSTVMVYVWVSDFQPNPCFLYILYEQLLSASSPVEP